MKRHCDQATTWYTWMSLIARDHNWCFGCITVAYHDVVK